MPVTLAIIERHGAVAGKLKPFLADKPEFALGSVYTSGEDAVHGVPDAQPDLMLVDATLSPMTSVECIIRLKSRLPRLPMLVLADAEENELALALESLCAGADGCVGKNLSPEGMVKAIELARAGEAPLPAPVAGHLIGYLHRVKFGARADDLAEKFTLRELAILKLSAQGHGEDEIACKLNVPSQVIKADRREILEKLHTNTRIQALTGFLKAAPDFVKNSHWFFNVPLFAK